MDNMGKKGLLVTNRFLNTGKFTQLNDYLFAAAAKLGIALAHRFNSDLLFDAAKKAPLAPLPGADFVLFFDKDAILGEQLEARGLRLFNTPRSVALCDDKALTHLALAGKVEMPETVIAPMTFSGVGYNDTGFLEGVVEALGLPLVVKHRCGSFGQQVYLAHTRKEAETLLQSAAAPVLFQRFIRESAGRDLRINVVGGEPVAAMERYNEKDFRANVTIGGSMRPYAPTKEEQRMAVTACQALGLDFAGVDIVHGKDGPLLLEVNSNAHFKTIFACTGVNVAERIMAHIQREIWP